MACCLKELACVLIAVSGTALQIRRADAATLADEA